jgi:hypothetical protein
MPFQLVLHKGGEDENMLKNIIGMDLMDKTV